MTSKIHSAQRVGGKGGASGNTANKAGHNCSPTSDQQRQKWQNAPEVQPSPVKGLTSVIDKRSQKLKEEIDRLKSFIPPIPATPTAPATFKDTDHKTNHRNPPQLAPLASLDYTSITTTTSTIEPSGSLNATIIDKSSSSSSSSSSSGTKTSNYSCDKDNRENKTTTANSGCKSGRIATDQSPLVSSSTSSVDTPTLSGYYDCDELSDMVDDSLFEITTAGCLSRSVFPRESTPSCRLNYADHYKRHCVNQAAADRLGASSGQRVGDRPTDDQDASDLDGDRTPTDELRQKDIGAGGEIGCANDGVLASERRQFKMQDNSSRILPPAPPQSSSASQVASIMAHVQSHDYSSTTSVPRQIRSSLTIASGLVAGPNGATGSTGQLASVRHNSYNSASNANTKISSVQRGGPVVLGARSVQAARHQPIHQEQSNQQRRISSSKRSNGHHQQQQQQPQLAAVITNTDTSDDAADEDSNYERRISGACEPSVQAPSGRQIATVVNRKLSNNNKSQSSGALSSVSNSRCPVCCGIAGGGDQAVVTGDKHKMNKTKSKRKFTFSLFNLFTSGGGGGGTGGAADRLGGSDEISDSLDGRRHVCCCHHSAKEYNALERPSISSNSSNQLGSDGRATAVKTTTATTSIRPNLPSGGTTKKSAPTYKSNQRAKSASASNRASGQAAGRTLPARPSGQAEYHPLPAMRLRDSIKITNQRKLRSSSAGQNTSGNNRDPGQGEVLLDLSRQSQIGARLSNSGGGSSNINGAGTGRSGLPRKTVAARPSDSSMISASSTLSSASSFKTRASSGTTDSAAPIAAQQQQQRQFKCVKFTTPDRVILSSPKNTSSSLASRRRQQQQRQGPRDNSQIGGGSLRTGPAASAVVLAPIIKRPATVAASEASAEVPPADPVPKSSSYSQTEPSKSLDEMLAKYELNTELVAEINMKLQLTDTIASNLSALDQDRGDAHLDNVPILDPPQRLQNQEQSSLVKQTGREQVIDCEQGDEANEINIATPVRGKRGGSENDADDDGEAQVEAENEEQDDEDDDEGSENGRVVILDEEDEDELIQRRLEFIEASRVFGWGPDDELAAAIPSSVNKEDELQRRLAFQLQLEAAEAEAASKCECNRTRPSETSAVALGETVEIGVKAASTSEHPTAADSGVTICNSSSSSNNNNNTTNATDSILVTADCETAISGLTGLDMHGDVKSASQIRQSSLPTNGQQPGARALSASVDACDTG